VTRTLIDTSAYSALMRGQPAARDALREADQVLMSVVVLGELRAGFRKGSRPGRYEGILREFLDEPRVQVVGTDEETSVRYAIIHDYLRRRGTPVSVNDVWIAAAASQHGARVLTADGDFRRIAQVVVDYIGPMPERP
jgi:tRNA(fMet)-specific endonuclease VapC